MASLFFNAASAPDLAVYLARLVRLDTQAVVRLKRVDDDRVAIWCWTPLEVLALRGVSGQLSETTDITVRADALLDKARAVKMIGRIALPPAQDLHWRGPLPPSSGTALDTIAPSDVEGLLEAAERTFREVSAIAAIPQRAGEELLDHVALTVTDDDRSAEVGVRQLVVAARLGFLPDAARVGIADPGWTFVAARHGVVYRRINSSPLSVL